MELFAAKGNFATWGASFVLVGDSARGGLRVRSQPGGKDRAIMWPWGWETVAEKSRHLPKP